jgi:copper chaperone CopZ
LDPAVLRCDPPGIIQPSSYLVDLAAGKVAVESSASVKTLKDAIDDAGYTVVAVANQ